MPRRKFPPYYHHFVKRLAQAREAAGLTQEDIDEALNRPDGYCAEWEAQLRAIDYVTLQEFARLVLVPAEWLLAGGGVPPKRHPPVHTVADALGVVGPKQGVNKKNWSEAFSRALAIVFANVLRTTFVGISPFEDGRHQERLAPTNRGFKKLDVGYSTEELGLSLGVSIKSINFKDEGTKRYTKNYSRNDCELRAEAMDYHRRQPFAVLAGVLMLPLDSCDDAGKNPHDESSFAAAVRYFKRRSGRVIPDGDADLFELFFVGLYDENQSAGGHDFFVDVSDPPPQKGRPLRRPFVAPAPPYLDLSLEEVAERIKAKYEEVNIYSFDYA